MNVAALTRPSSMVQIRANAEFEYRQRMSMSYRTFLTRVNPRFEWHPHCVTVANVLQRVAENELKRVMILEPPRHGKSEQLSRTFPSYLMYRYPRTQIGLCSYGDSLALGFARNARDNYRYAGGSIRADVSGVHEWQTTHGGIMWAAGVGGPITGRGFNFGIIDDPLKNYAEALSARIRQNQMEWYDTTFMTRSEPDAAVVIAMTRWHEEDLVGVLLERERDSDEPEKWHVVSLEAIKSTITYSFAPSVTIEADNRKVGEPLCPARYPLDKLKKQRARMPLKFWISLYQQSPKPDEGNIWKLAWFRKYDPIQLSQKKPEDEGYVAITNIGTDWDLAYSTKDENSASAYVKAGIDIKTGNVYVMDCGWEWFEFPKMIRWMAEVGGPWFIEAKASGKSAKQTLRENGLAAFEVQVQGADKSGVDKVSRANLATPPAAARRVYISNAIWTKLLSDPKQGILNFPSGPYSDLNDAFVQMINRLVKRKKVSIGSLDEFEDAPKNTDEAGNLMLTKEKKSNTPTGKKPAMIESLD